MLQEDAHSTLAPCCICPPCKSVHQQTGRSPARWPYTCTRLIHQPAAARTECCLRLLLLMRCRHCYSAAGLVLTIMLNCRWWCTPALCPVPSATSPSHPPSFPLPSHCCSSPLPPPPPIAPPPPLSRAHRYFLAVPPPLSGLVLSPHPPNRLPSATLPYSAVLFPRPPPAKATYHIVQLNAILEAQVVKLLISCGIKHTHTVTAAKACAAHTSISWATSTFVLLLPLLQPRQQSSRRAKHVLYVRPRASNS